MDLKKPAFFHIITKTLCSSLLINWIENSISVNGNTVSAETKKYIFSRFI